MPGKRHHIPAAALLDKRSQLLKRGPVESSDLLCLPLQSTSSETVQASLVSPFFGQIPSLLICRSLPLGCLMCSRYR